MYITKNSISRKFVIFSLAFLLYASSLLGSYNRSAYANPLLGAVGIAGAAAAGPYIIAGLLVAGGAAAVIGLNDDDVRRKAEEIYARTSDGFKTTLSQSVDFATNTVNLTEELTGELTTLLKDTTTQYASWVSTLLKEFESSSVQVGNIEYSAYSGQHNIFSKDTTKLLVGLNGVAYAGFTGFFSSDEFVYSGMTDNTSAVGYIRIPVSADRIQAFNTVNDYATYKAWLQSVGIAVGMTLPNTAVDDDFNANIDKVLNDFTGINEVNIPLDQWLGNATTATGEPLVVDTATGATTYPDGAVYEGDVTIPWTIPALPTTAVPTVANPAIPIADVFPNTTTPPPPTGDGGTGTGNPFTNLVPVSFLMVLLDLLRAILMYLARMFTFIMTIPLIPTKPIDNSAFEWFKSAKIVGVHIYSVVSTLASIGLSFAVYKSIRRLLP